ncbi:S-layer homology domain-containing protein [Muriventricola aceti]|uniref:S-layer homology domain-containing protein n=1 Tax=Muriventricola aceti TaxID=2981773 RepID=UPI003EBDDA1B
MKKKLLAGFMTLCMLLSLVPSAVFAVEDQSSQADAADEATVSTREELEAALNNSSVSTINIAQDIEMGDTDWEGIQIESGRVLVINGNGNAISDLKVHKAYMGPNGSGIPGDGGSCDYYTGWIANNKGTLTINDLTFSGAEIDANPLTTAENSTGSSILAVVVANNTGTLTYNNVNVVDSTVRGYTKVGLLHGFTQSGSFVANKCSVTNSHVVLEADGTDPEACFSGVLIGYDGSNKAKTNGISMSGCDITIDDSVNWEAEIATKPDGTRYVGSYGLTSPTYTHGGYGIDSVAFVAEVGGYQYETLADAIAAAQDGDTVNLLDSITCTANTDLTEVKSVTVDFAKNTFTGDNKNIAIRSNAKGTGLLTLMNGTITAGDGTYCTLGAADGSTIVAKDMVLNNSTAFGASIKAFAGGTIELRDSQLNSTTGGGVTAAGGTVNIYNSNISQTGYYDHNSMIASASNGTGIVNIYSGEFTSENYGLYIFNSGGTINVYGGTFTVTGDKPVLKADKSTTSIPSIINVTGGTFTGSFGVADGATLSITGGTFSEKPDEKYIVPGYTANEVEGKWVVEAKLGMEADTIVSDDTVSAEVVGKFNTSGENGEGVETSGGKLEISVTTGVDGQPAENVDKTTVTIQSISLESVKDSAVSEVAIATDVGTVTLDKDAWNTITEKADGSSVALTVEEKIGGGWTVSAVNASGDPVFSAEDDSRKGEITVSVPYTPAQELAQGDKVVVYYVSEDGQLESMTTIYEAGTLSWTTDHLSDFIGVIIGEDDEAVWVSGSSIQTGKLADALADSNLAGGNIYLVKDAALDSAEFTISKNITILKDENAAAVPAITATVAAGPTTGAFTITENAALTLNGVKLTVKGTADTEGKGGNYDGTGFILNNSANGNGGKLILNNAEVELTGLQRGMVFQVAAANLASVEMTNSKLTIQNIDGNASNGGVWNIKDHSTLTVNGCGDYGLSVQDITVDNSTVNVTNVDKTGVVAQDVTVSGGGSISVTNSGKELPCKDWQGNDMNAVVELKSDGSLTVDENSKLTASGNKDQDGKPVDKIDINGGTLDNKGAITGEIVTTAPAGSHTVKVVVNGQVIDIQTVTNGDSFTLPAAPAGGNFQGWYDGTTVHAAGATVTITADVTFTASWYTSGGGGGGGSSSYSISVDKNIDNGSVTVSPKSASSGRTVTITVKADEGYELDELTVTDKNGDEIELTDKGDGRYTFKMPRSKVTIEASFVEIDHQDTCPAAGFRDVDEDAWYHEAVDYALDNGLMSGVSDREFAPGSTLTRAMVAQMLYSLEGKPAAGRADFADVAEGAWYADAISWAAGEGIVSGYGDTFGPNDPITREQLAAILYRYAQNEGYKTSQSGKGTEGYLDASSISSYAVKAMDWAVNAGLLSGKGNNTLAPTAGATRAEVAQIFMNFCKDIVK